MVEKKSSYNTEYSVTFTAVTDSIINNVMFVSCLLSAAIFQELKSFVNATHVNERQAPVEQHLGGVQFKLKTELFVIAAEEESSIPSPEIKSSDNSHVLVHA